jgi:hypothetical protein
MVFYNCQDLGTSLEAGALFKELFQNHSLEPSFQGCLLCCKLLVQELFQYPFLDGVTLMNMLHQII